MMTCGVVESGEVVIVLVELGWWSSDIRQCSRS